MRNWRRIISHRRRRQHILKNTRLAGSSLRTTSYIFTVPQQIAINLVLCGSNLYIYIYDAQYSLTLTVNLASIMSLRYYSDTNSIAISYIRHSYLQRIGIGHQLLFIYAMYMYFMGKLTISGKIGRIFVSNKRRFLILRFGTAHRVCIYIDGLHVKFIRQTTMRLVALNYYTLKEKSTELLASSNTREYRISGAYPEGVTIILRAGKVDTTL